MIRFNEAIDQMLAESVGQFAARTERLRDMFAGILAHDLRSPVGAIMASTYLILRDEHLSPTSLRAGANLQRSAERVKTMIDDFSFIRARVWAISCQSIRHSKTLAAFVETRSTRFNPPARALK
jgi:signal transduction histidine kinase